ncbi:hypothetical protein [Agromyces sp. H66]|uniref:hypothetical protein n=1 Tax=Agromyces sp. H66 TaxID=2529859 RepID=UPI0010A9C808|nr:hypothetical protein [Agromyces sp. H66]
MRRRTTSITFAGAVVGLIASLMAGPAFAADPGDGPDGTPSPEITVQNLPYEEPAVVPAPGKEVTIVGAEGVTTYYGITASCTESVTANNPYKSSGKAVAHVQFQRSSGCVGSKTGTALLDSYTIWWSEYNRKATTVNPGVNVVLTVSYPCQNSNSTSWRSGGLFNNGSVTYSASTSLSCGH